MTIVVQKPGLLGWAIQRFTGTRFERQQVAPSSGLDRLLIYDGEQLIALFPPGQWQAAWLESAVVQPERKDAP